MKVLNVNFRLGLLLLFLIAGTAAIVRAHQNARHAYPYRDGASVDSTILINSQQGISVQPVTRLSQ